MKKYNSLIRAVKVTGGADLFSEAGRLTVDEKLGAEDRERLIDHLHSFMKYEIQMSHVCFHCDKRKESDYKFKRCSRSRVALYCSVECQKAAWPEHKKECKPFDSGAQRPFDSVAQGPFDSGAQGPFDSGGH
jgi:hypothetical protein